eukprot:TCONS_00037652-protein
MTLFVVYLSILSKFKNRTFILSYFYQPSFGYDYARLDQSNSIKQFKFQLKKLNKPRRQLDIYHLHCIYSLYRFSQTFTNVNITKVEKPPGYYLCLTYTQ